MIDLIEEAGALPLTVIAVAGLPAGGGPQTGRAGEAVPGFLVGNLPEDGVEDEAQVRGRATREKSVLRVGSGPGRGGGEERLDQDPLFGGQLNGAPPCRVEGYFRQVWKPALHRAVFQPSLLENT
jgi:hypothetical protein